MPIKRPSGSSTSASAYPPSIERRPEEAAAIDPLFGPPPLSYPAVRRPAAAAAAAAVEDPRGSAPPDSISGIAVKITVLFFYFVDKADRPGYVQVEGKDSEEIAVLDAIAWAKAALNTVVKKVEDVAETALAYSQKANRACQELEGGIDPDKAFDKDREYSTNIREGCSKYPEVEEVSRFLEAAATAWEIVADIPNAAAYTHNGAALTAAVKEVFDKSKQESAKALKADRQVKKAVQMFRSLRGNLPPNSNSS